MPFGPGNEQYCIGSHKQRSAQRQNGNWRAGTSVAWYLLELLKHQITPVIHCSRSSTSLRYGIAIASSALHSPFSSVRLLPVKPNLILRLHSNWELTGASHLLLIHPGPLATVSSACCLFLMHHPSLPADPTSGAAALHPPGDPACPRPHLISPGSSSRQADQLLQHHLQPCPTFKVKNNNTSRPFEQTTRPIPHFCAKHIDGGLRSWPLSIPA
ncbi:hypothetical protein V2G26_005362 [Clonostachys chloroleuca]